ncbi:MAG: dihydrofolate reductase [bacterium]
MAAVSKNNVIGSNGKVPWHIPGELEHFKKTTIGFPVIMGRKTFEAMAKPLRGRINIVLAKNPGLFEQFEEVEFVDSLEVAYNYCKSLMFTKAFIIGGGQVYKEAIKDADELIVSHIPIKYEGDTFFPIIDKNIWELREKEKNEEFELHHYFRR